MLIRIAGLLPVTLVNGEGVRYAVFVQGCPHACKGCHNPDTHQFDGGRLMDTAEIIAEIRRKRKLLDGVTLSGGEPMCQTEACKEIADAAHEMGLNVWCYTGFTWNALMKEADPLRMALLENVDVLVDGPYIESLRTTDLLWRGSKNQKLIDVQKSLREGRKVEVKNEDQLYGF